MTQLDAWITCTCTMLAADMNGTRLATLIADRLNAVVPETFTVSAENGVVGITSSKVWWGGQSFVGVLAAQPNNCETGGEYSALESAAWNALSAVQDYISEVEKEMWPGGADYGSPSVAVERGALRLW